MSPLWQTEKALNRNYTTWKTSVGPKIHDVEEQ